MTAANRRPSLEAKTSLSFVQPLQVAAIFRYRQLHSDLFKAEFRGRPMRRFKPSRLSMMGINQTGSWAFRFAFNRAVSSTEVGSRPLAISRSQ
jgi:hypothetical protein